MVQVLSKLAITASDSSACCAVKVYTDELNSFIVMVVDTASVFFIKW